MRRFSVFSLAALLVLTCGCAGSSGSSTANATVVINTSPARADVDAGNSFTLDAYATVTGNSSAGSALGFALQGAGTMAITGPSLFGDYSVLYTAPGNPITGNGTSLTGTSAAITITSKSNAAVTLAVPISLHDNIQFSAQVPPAALAGKPYTFTFTGSGGTGTLTFQVVSTSAPLPPGLALSSSGVLSGTPTAVGTYSFTVVCYDQATRVVGIGRTFTLLVS